MLSEIYPEREYCTLYGIYFIDFIALEYFNRPIYRISYFNKGEKGSNGNWLL